MPSGRPKILFLVSLPPPVHGAALRNQSLVNSKLLKNDFEIKVLRMKFIDEMNQMGKFSFSKVLKSIAFELRLVYSLMSFRPKLVYFNISTFGFALLRDFIFAQTVKVLAFNVALHIRTQKVKEQTQSSKFKKWLFRKYLDNAEVICLSKNLAKDIEDVTSETPIIINNGVPLLDFQGKERTKVDKVRFLFLSNFLSTKGIKELIDASLMLKNIELNFSLVIAGSDFDLSFDQVKKMVEEAGLNEHVEVKGPQYGEEKIDELINADVFVLPSYFEAFPGAILDAMQAALPVISTFEGAIPEMVVDGESGILVEKQNSKALFEAMKDLLSNSDKRERMGREGKRIFNDKFTMDIFEKNIDSLFKRLTNS